MVESTREPVVRLDGGRVVLVADLDVGVGRNVAGPADVRVAVSPARALELLEDLRGLVPDLRDVVAEQKRRAEEERRAAALRSAMDLVMTEPLLAGWYSLEQTWDTELGRIVQVNYADARAQALREYAATAGVPARDESDQRWVAFLLGSGEQGWLRLRAFTPGLARPAAGPTAPAEHAGAGRRRRGAEVLVLADRLAPDGAL